MRIIKPGFWVTIATLSMLSQATFGLSLQQTYTLALQNNATYLNALAQHEANKLDLPLAQSSNKPVINATAGLTQNHDQTDFDGAAVNSANYERTQLGLSLNKSLYSKSVNHNIEAAKLGVEISALQLALSKETLISTTVERYLGVLSALDNEQLARLERAAIEQQLDLSTQRLEVGLGTKTDQFDAQARFESSKAGVILANNEVANARQALESLMAQTLPDDLKQAMNALDNSKVELRLNQSKQWLEVALERNLAYLIKLRQLALTEIEVARTVDASLPVLNLVAGVSAANVGSGSQSSGSQKNWNVGVQGSIPIYLGGSIKLKQTKAAFSMDAAKSAAEQAKRDTNRSIESAQRGVIALQGQVKALSQAVRASESALESKEAGFNAGVTTNLDVLDGQRDLFRARRDYLKASYDLVNAAVQLERAAGALNDEDITRIDGWLN